MKLSRGILVLLTLLIVIGGARALWWAQMREGQTTLLRLQSQIALSAGVTPHGIEEEVFSAAGFPFSLQLSRPTLNLSLPLRSPALHDLQLSPNMPDLLLWSGRFYIEVNGLGNRYLIQAGNASCALQYHRVSLLGSLWSFEALARMGAEPQKWSVQCSNVAPSNAPALTQLVQALVNQALLP